MAIVDGTIKCSTCRKPKELKFFRPSVVLRKSGMCKSCSCMQNRSYEARNKEKVSLRSKIYREKHKVHYIEIAKAWRKRNPEKVRGHNLKNNYGIDEHEYNRIFSEQGGHCALCSATQGSANKPSLFVDHCHETGKIRGLLCRRCNTGIGLLGDNFAAIQRAANYLEKAGEKKSWLIVA